MIYTDPIRRSNLPIEFLLANRELISPFSPPHHLLHRLGSKTWDRYQMRIYKRIIDLKNTSSDIVRQVTSVGIYTNVDCVVTISS